MTAAELGAVGTPAVVAESFGLPACDTHLIAKLRCMPEDLRAYVLAPTTTTHVQLPKERP